MFIATRDVDRDQAIAYDLEGRHMAPSDPSARLVSKWILLDDYKPAGAIRFMAAGRYQWFSVYESR